MNFKYILSKSSLRSSSSGKSLSKAEELTKLHCDIESLKQVVESLKISLESRDSAIGTLARQKEKVYIELKSAQRTIQDLQQQLGDERDIHLKEKSYLIEEIQNLSRKEDFEGVNSISNDEEIIDSLQDQLLAKDKVIYTVCAKFMKLKTIKSSLQKRLRRLQTETQETYETMILLQQENKATMENLFEKLIRYSAVSRSSRKYLKLLKMNVKLHYENVQLKMSLLRNSQSAEESETVQYQDKDNDNDALQMQRHKPTNTMPMVASEDESENNPKPHKRRVKLQQPKFKSNKRHSPAIISNFYKERKSLSVKLRETLSKSSSMPCLR